jgi:hypothetical protein
MWSIRALKWAGLLLALSLSLAAVSSVAHALDFLLPTGKTVRFEIPSGYCADELPGWGGRRLRNATIEQQQPGTHVLQSFELCGADPTTNIGYFGWQEWSPVHDLRRAQILLDLTGFLESFPEVFPDPQGLPTAIKVAASLDSGVFVDTRKIVGESQIVTGELWTIAGDRMIVVSITRIFPTVQTDEALVDYLGDVFRNALLPALHQLGDTNGFEVREDVSAEDGAGAVQLAVWTVMAAFGAISLVALTVASWRNRIVSTVAISIAAGLIYQSAPGRSLITGNPLVDFSPYVVSGLLVLLVVLGAIWLLGLATVRGRTLAERLQATVDTDRWPGVETSDRSGFAKRWFVTIAAVTGAVICSLLNSDILFALGNAFTPTRIVFTILAALISAVLFAPIEDYIFESGLRGQAAAAHGGRDTMHRLERLLQLSTPQAFGRFLVVVVFFLMLNGIQGALETQMSGADAFVTAMIVITATTPAAVTYYWCAALQRRLQAITWRTTIASTIAGAVLIGVPMALLFAYFMSGFFLVANPLSSPLESALVILACIGVLTLGAPLLGFVLVGVAALAGGLAIDAARKRGLSANLTVALAGIAIVLQNTIVSVIMIVVLAAVAGIDLAVTDPVPMIMAALWPIGWTAGLFLGNFSGVLRRSQSDVATTAPVQPAA